MQQFIRRRVTHHSIRRKPCQLDKSKRLAIRKLSVDIRQVAQPFRRRQYFTEGKNVAVEWKTHHHAPFFVCLPLLDVQQLLK